MITGNSCLVRSQALPFECNSSGLGNNTTHNRTGRLPTVSGPVMITAAECPTQADCMNKKCRKYKWSEVIHILTN